MGASGGGGDSSCRQPQAFDPLSYGPPRPHFVVCCELVDVAVDGIVVGSGGVDQVGEVVDVGYTAVAASGGK